MTARSIFVVEDDAIVALMNYELLTKAGYEVPQMFASGEELLDYLGSPGLPGPLLPDLILMDIGLDGRIDGLETARRVRERYNVPVMFVSSYSDDEKKVSAQEISSCQYIVKPVVEHQFIAIIGETLGMAAADDQGS